MKAQRSAPAKTRVPLEVSDLMVLCTHPLDTVHLHCVVQFEGRIDAERLEWAFRQSLVAEPLLNCRFVDHWLNPYWECPAPDPPAFSLVESPSPDALSTFLNAPLEPGGAQVQLALVRTATDSLAIKISHLVADAAALKQYVYTLAALYSGSDLIWGSTRRSIAQVMRSFSWRQKLTLLRLAVKSHAESAVALNSWHLVAEHSEDQRYVVYPLGLERLGPVKAYARQSGATVGDVTLAAFFIALCRLIPQATAGPLPVRTTVDLRRYLSGQAHALCNLSGVIGVAVELEPDANLVQAVAAVRAQMDRKKATYLGLAAFDSLPLLLGRVPYPLLQGLVKAQLQPLTRTGRLAPLFTNMGLLDPERLYFAGSPVEEAFLTPSVPGLPLLMVGLSSFRGSLTLSTGLHAGLLCATGATELFEHLDAVLPV